MTQTVRKEKKSVRFVDERDNTCHLVEPLSSLNTVGPAVWYHPQELRTIKKEALQSCRDAQRFGLGGLLTEIYCTGHKETQDRLNYWCRMGSSVRGLERFANGDFNARRSAYRKRAVVSVVRAQEELKNEKGIDTTNILKRLSEAYTEQARVFSQRLGQADEHALYFVEHSTAETEARPGLQLIVDAKKQSDRGVQAMSDNTRKSSDRLVQKKVQSASMRNVTQSAALLSL